MTNKVECVDCVVLPKFGEQTEAELVSAQFSYRPAKPRPIHPSAGPRKPRCATHYRAHKKAARARAHDTRVVKVYDLGPGEYAELLAAQGGTCAFPRCRANGARKRLAVDHDHTTGEVRGLLCGPHNYQLVGKFAGDLRDALDYLADPPARRLRSAS